MKQTYPYLQATENIFFQLPFCGYKPGYWLINRLFTGTKNGANQGLNRAAPLYGGNS